MGPMAEFTADNIIAVTGANLGARVKRQGTAVQVHRRFLKLCRHVQRQQGLCGICRRAGYPVIMGSKSTNLKSRVGGYEGKKTGGRR